MISNEDIAYHIWYDIQMYTLATYKIKFSILVYKLNYTGAI